MIYYMNNWGIIEVGEDYTFLFLVSSQNFINASDGILQGKGQFDITASFTNDGTISPAGEGDIGMLEIINNFSMSASAKLVIEIDGTASNAFDHINNFGTPDLNGTIDVRLNYDANINDEFEIINATLGIGSCNFPDEIISSYDGFDYTFDVICNSNSVVLRVQDITLGVPDSEDNNLNFQVIPNPANANSHFSYDQHFESEYVNINIYDLLGKKLFNVESSESGQFMKQLNLPSGIYIAELRDGKDVLAFTKFIVP